VKTLKKEATVKTEKEKSGRRGNLNRRKKKNSLWRKAVVESESVEHGNSAERLKPALNKYKPVNNASPKPVKSKQNRPCLGKGKEIASQVNPLVRNRL